MLRFMGENISEQEIQNIIEEADVDNDGVIDYSEFYTIMMAKHWKKKLLFVFFPHINNYMHPTTPKYYQTIILLIISGKYQRNALPYKRK